MVGEPTVHCLLYGRPLCGFSNTVPAEWAPGNVWAGLEDADKVTCRTCKERAEAINKLRPAS